MDTESLNNTQTHNEVKEYYGKILTSTTDLKTNACCTMIKYPDHIKNAIALVHEEVNAKYYGCGITIPSHLEGLRVLDLGSGSGRDSYILSRLVGEKGYVVGVDMTDEQLEIANQYIDYHTKKFGYSKPNIEFKKGYIEHLDKLDLKDNSFDLVISNCVINLCPDKEAVLNEVYRVLKPGGELYFSDVYSDRRIPKALVNNPILYGECLSGALYWNDFLRTAKKSGFNDPRQVASKSITINQKEVQKLTGNIKFDSITYRLFKIPELEDACEDFGQAVIYKGTIPNHEKYFQLDNHHCFKKGKTTLVCGNTSMMLSETRFKDHFDFIGDMSTHYGIFPCGETESNLFKDSGTTSNSCGC